MLQPTLRDLAEAALSFTAYTSIYVVGFLLVANLSFYRADAALVAFGLIVLLSFARFAFWGNRRLLSFLAGVFLSWGWFLIGLVLLDWAVGNCPGPTQLGFYSSALRLLVTPEALLIILAPASIVAVATLVGYSIGSLVLWLRSKLQAPNAS